MHARNLPSHDFTASKRMALRDNQFHTYAVEVTRDARLVVRRHQGDPDRAPFRGAHRRGLQHRFRLQATPGASMRQGRMQMDWVRYYGLERENAKSINAPALRHTSYARAC